MQSISGPNWRGPDAAASGCRAGKTCDSPEDRPPSKEDAIKVSARNQLRGTVRRVQRGEAIANVELDVAGQRLVASITVEAVDELGLAEGSDVTALIKASDVMLATD
jgi:molybdopterin-binding protein